MGKTKNTTSQDVQTSISSIYSSLLEKRRIEREEREEKRREEIEAKAAAKAEEKEKKKNEDPTKLSKKERRAAELESWKEIVVGLTGDDLEYAPQKKSKKKYRKWIDDDDEVNAVLNAKPKKVKKKNYHKEFEAEINMLKTLVADQNRFTAELQKRYQIAAGPNTKDAMPLNKTLVDLASVINNGRANSLGVLREIGTIKKNVADLYMKQKKLDADLGVSGMSTTDIGLMGSNIASSLFGDEGSFVQPTTSPYNQQQPQYQNQNYQQQQYPQGENLNIQQSQNIQTSPIDNNGFIQGTASFDPSSWDGPEIASDSPVMYEAIPHSVVVEWHKNENKARFKAIRNDNGEELVGCPVPTTDPAKLVFNEKDLTVKGEFDESYKLEIIQ